MKLYSYRQSISCLAVSLKGLFFFLMLSLISVTGVQAQTTETYTVNPGIPLDIRTSGNTVGPNPGIYGAFTYSYRNASRALTADVFWADASYFGVSEMMAADYNGAQTGRELDIAKTDGGAFAFYGLSLQNYSPTLPVLFQGYNGTTKVYDSGSININDMSMTIYTPASPWTGITELRIVSASGAIFDPQWDDFRYSLAPAVTTGTATGITATSATLSSIVNANNVSTSVTIQYGLTTSYGTTVATIPATATGSSATSVLATLTGLTSNTTYHYRVVGVNAAGTTNGLDKSFTTSLGTGFDNATVNALSIYPNPATDGFTIDAAAQTTTVSIYDLSGSLLLTRQATGKTYIDITSLPKGLYVVKANGLVAKLVKK